MGASSLSGKNYWSIAFYTKPFCSAIWKWKVERVMHRELEWPPSFMHQITSQLNSLCVTTGLKMWSAKYPMRKKYTASAHQEAVGECWNSINIHMEGEKSVRPD